MKTILIYLSKESQFKEINIQKSLSDLDYELRFLSEEDLTYKVCYLINEKKDLQQKNDILDYPLIDFMLMPPMDQEELKIFIQHIKKNQATIEHKAMLTQTNRDWFVCDLMEEVREEHLYFLKRHELQSLIQACLKLNQENVDSDFQYKIMEAYDVLQNQQSTMDHFLLHLSTLTPLYQIAIKRGCNE